MTHTGQLARRAAPWMLGAWVLTWAFMILLPCCQAIAGTVARHHGEGTTSHSHLGVPHTHAHVHPHGYGDGYPGHNLAGQDSAHTHCGAPRLDDLELHVVLLAADMDPIEGKVQHLLPAQSVALNPAAMRQVRWFAHLKHPPPPLPRLYLRTERLRI